MGHEQEPRIELSPEQLRAYAATFIPRWDCYSIQRPEGQYTAIKQPLTTAHVEAHFRGQITIGAYALDQSSQAQWVCFDADDEQEWSGLVSMAAQLQRESVPTYIEQSRRGGHVWLFTHPLPGREARRFGKQLLQEHQLPSVELYPKQDRLVTGPGSLVRLPLGIHRKSNRRYHFINIDGEALAPTVREQIALLANQQRVPPSFVAEVLQRAPEARLVLPTPKYSPTEGPISGDTVSERIKNRIAVADFVSQYVQLDRGGKGLCPFHDDHEESFSINQDGNYWHCFAGCGGGSVIDFWMKWRGVHGQSPDFKDTVTELAKMLL